MLLNTVVSSDQIYSEWSWLKTPKYRYSICWKQGCFLRLITVNKVDLVPFNMFWNNVVAGDQIPWIQLVLDANISIFNILSNKVVAGDQMQWIKLS